MAERDVITLLRWDSRSNHKVFVGCLTNEKSDFAIVVARYKIWYGIYNRITGHSAIPSTCVRSILFAFSKVAPRVSLLSDRKEVAFCSYQKPIIHWERGCVFSCSKKIELRSLTQVSHVTKKKKKKAKGKKESKEN